MSEIEEISQKFLLRAIFLKFIFYTMKTNLDMDRTNSLGLLNYSKEFYEAANIIRNDKGAISTVAYYLICHSLELSFKAFLRGKGDSINSLKKLGHDLEKILKKAEGKNIKDLMQISDEYREAISIVSTYYCEKEFEYIKTGFKTFPNIDILLRFAEDILSNIHKFCINNMRHHNGKQTAIS
ncbi:MAG: hypothetical protein HY578_01485 [Nitrospinae bacterium]|nr:hypothetical protein [Nitrospinota bacterium]